MTYYGNTTTILRLYYSNLQVCRLHLATHHYISLRSLPVTTGFVGKLHCLLMKPVQEAHASQQFLIPSQERLLCKWIEHLGATGCPLCKWTIWVRAQHLHLDNKQPSKNWIYAFLKQHLNIVLSSASGLDPKRAKAFNRPVVNQYFDELNELVESQGIPIENIYNMDEK